MMARFRRVLRASLLGMAVMAALAPTSPALAQCSHYVIEQMRRAGVPDSEIERRCGRTLGPDQRVRTGTRCETRAGSCSVAPAPIGSPCWCPSPLGSIAGRIGG